MPRWGTACRYRSVLHPRWQPCVYSSISPRTPTMKLSGQVHGVWALQVNFEVAQSGRMRTVQQTPYPESGVAFFAPGVACQVPVVVLPKRSVAVARIVSGASGANSAFVTYLHMVLVLPARASPCSSTRPRSPSNATDTAVVLPLNFSRRN